MRPPLKIDFSCGDYKKKDAEIERLNTELAQAREADRWIPVDERLPEGNTQVLFRSYSGVIIQGSYYPRSDCWIGEEGAYRGVNWWRPLPTPPEQEANG